MKRARDIERMVQDLRHPVDAQSHDRILERLLSTLQRHRKPQPAAAQPHTGRTIMKNPITKLAVAAAIVAAVVLGLFEFISTDSGSGVVWAEVAEKVQASGGLTLRITGTGSMGPEDAYSIKYFSPVGSRTDDYKDGQIRRSNCSNYETMTSTYIQHAHKSYISTQYQEGIEGFLEKDEDWTNPKYIVQKILSVEHKELAERTIDGVLCEGLETSDPAVMGAELVEMVDHIEIHLELWVDVQTQYPVRFESTVTADFEGEHHESDCVMDQFQWDVEIDPGLFTIEMPAGYIDITPGKQ